MLNEICLKWNCILCLTYTYRRIKQQLEVTSFVWTKSSLIIEFKIFMYEHKSSITYLLCAINLYNGIEFCKQVGIIELVVNNP